MGRSVSAKVQSGAKLLCKSANVGGALVERLISWPVGQNGQLAGRLTSWHVGKGYNARGDGEKRGRRTRREAQGPGKPEGAGFEPAKLIRSLPI